MDSKKSLPKLPSRTLICALRVAPSFYKAVQEAIAENGDPTVILWQGQAKVHGDGTANPSLFVQDNFSDHPGAPLSPEEKAAIQEKLRDPSYKLHIINGFAGDNANTRAIGGAFAIMHADIEYRAKGGVSRIAYDLLYDGDGRNDKIHEVEHEGDDGKSRKISEDNAPTGIYAPQLYRRSGADEISVFDPHSKKHEENLRAAFDKASVSILSTLSQMADNIIATHEQAILDGRFRIGAPDGWDKKDDPERNAAIGRVFTVAGLIWQRMPELQTSYKTPRAFADAIIFGLTKIRQAAYPGAPAKPVVTGLHGDVKGCDCQLLDDLADSGGSLIQSGNALLKAGATNVDAAVCHGPAAESSLQRILNEKDQAGKPVIRQLAISNTMPRVEEFHSRLGQDDKKRAALINSADAYIAYLRAANAP